MAYLKIKNKINETITNMVLGIWIKHPVFLLLKRKV